MVSLIRPMGFSQIRKRQMAGRSLQMPRKDVKRPVSKLPASYSLTWRLVKPFLGFILRRRAKQGKEDTATPPGKIWPVSNILAEKGYLGPRR